MFGCGPRSVPSPGPGDTQFSLAHPPHHFFMGDRRDSTAIQFSVPCLGQRNGLRVVQPDREFERILNALPQRGGQQRAFPGRQPARFGGQSDRCSWPYYPGTAIRKARFSEPNALLGRAIAIHQSLSTNRVAEKVAKRNATCTATRSQVDNVLKFKLNPSAAKIPTPMTRNQNVTNGNGMLPLLIRETGSTKTMSCASPQTANVRRSEGAWLKDERSGR